MIMVMSPMTIRLTVIHLQIRRHQLFIKKLSSGLV